jgi:methionine--tRNA ligase beta chain
MDMRVGKIVDVWVHPTSEKLYCEKIDIGNGEIRSIGSGLKNYIPIENMKDQMVIVLANLKPRNLGGFPSHGMVLCGKTTDETKIEFLRPPAGCVIGDVITFEGFVRNPPAVLNEKKLAWANVKAKLNVNNKSEACYGEIPFMTHLGVVKCDTITGGLID